MIDEADITFIPAVPGDFEYFRSLRMALTRPMNELQGIGWDAEWEENYHRERFIIGIKTKSLRMIHYKGLRIGFIGVRPEGQETKIEAFCIESEYQNHGIGTCVTKIVLTETDSVNRPVILDMLKVNPAVRLYERLGFEKTGEDWKVITLKRLPQFKPPEPSARTELLSCGSSRAPFHPKR